MHFRVMAVTMTPMTMTPKTPEMIARTIIAAEPKGETKNHNNLHCNI